jgi:ribosomal protein S18 acetylase RimI-like enzyme
MRGKGAGRALMAEVEQQARLLSGRVMVIYTSSTGKYAAARRLYEGAGFVRTAVVPDYYADGDDLNIYWKRIGIDSGEKR